MKRGVHAVAWVALAMAAFVLWPERWGGQMTYVITTGVSMEPAFVAGDLAVLRSRGAYSVGDVTAYDSRELGRIVMHRITEVTPDGYRLRGDNNDFVDPEFVGEDQVLGELVVRVPAVGRFLAWFVEPLHLGLAAVALLLVFGERKTPQSLPSAGCAAPLPRLRLRTLTIPSQVTRAEVVDAWDLERLAASHGVPVLEVEGQAECYVVTSGVVYGWINEAARPVGRLRTPQGRDWNYDRRHLRVVADRADARRSVS